jgi:integrative and conjugative element protein (TIGR02256 family)
LKFTNEELEIIIPDTVLKELFHHARNHYPNEFGGFLVGQYINTQKTASVTGFILPKKYKGRPTQFERSTNGLEIEFNRLFLEKGEYYLGEWHTHPNSSTKYSLTDLNAMKNTAECPSVTIANPLLLIISLTSQKISGTTFYHYENQKLVVYEQNRP